MQALLHGKMLIAILLYDPKYEQLSQVVATTIQLHQQALDADKNASQELTKFLSEVKALDITIYQQIKENLYE